MSNLKNATWIKASRPKKEAVVNFVKDFELRSFPTKAILEISCLGVYSCLINGKKVTESVLNPGWTDYNNRIQYQTFDVTHLIEKENRISVGVGQGWRFHDWYDLRSKIIHHGTTALIACLTVEYEDGDIVKIYTDESWKYTDSIVVYNNMYNGESIDFNVKFNKEKNVIPIEYTKEILIPQEGEYIIENEKIRGKKLFTTPQGDTVIDFGQELTGYVKFYVKGKKGDIINIRHFECLDKNGNIYTENLRKAKQLLSVKLDGKYHCVKPEYTFYGFRYIAIDGMEISSPDEIEAIAVHSQLERTGYINCSDATLNQLFHNIIWGQKGNFLDIPTDCPQRDERFGWTGDVQVFCKVASYNFNVEKFFSKWLGDLRVMQKPSGTLPNFVPNKFDDEGGSAGWSDVCCVLPWQMYLTYGHKEILEQNYDLMKKWVDFMRRYAKKRFVPRGEKTSTYLYEGHWHFGDWLALDLPNKEATGGATEKNLLASAFFAYSTSLLIKASEVLGKECEEYKKLYKNIKKAFIKQYITDDGRCTSDTQTGCVLCLHFGLYNDKKPLAEQLMKLIDKFGHLTTGFLGTPYLLHVLSDIGETDTAYKLLMRKEYPSWCYPISMGATTMWERWNGCWPDGSFATPEMNSFNHYAYGAVGDWMYEKMCGIQQKEGSYGFTDLVFEPKISSELNFAEGKLKTANGVIVSRWEKVGEQLEYTFIVPENTKAVAKLNNKNYDLTTGINKITL